LLIAIELDRASRRPDLRDRIEEGLTKLGPVADLALDGLDGGPDELRGDVATFGMRAR